MMIRVTDLFEVKYGVNLELNKLEICSNGINFVSRTAQNNGVSAKVKILPEVDPLPAGTITVAGGGSVLETFLQPEPYYSGRDLYYLTPRQAMTEEELLFYCACIKMNKYRYSYGRQANKTLKDLLIPDKNKIPSWVYSISVPNLIKFKTPANNSIQLNLNNVKWKYFCLNDLFDIKKGTRITKAKMEIGNIPFIASIDKNNGVRQYIRHKALHKGNTITVNYNGSVAQAFYQPVDFCASDDVNVLYPRFNMNKYIALFLVTVIMKEKYRFNYGRKWHVERMVSSNIKLPIDDQGVPYFNFMEQYILTLPYSKII